MSRHNRESNSEYRSKQRLFCCSCFTKKRSSNPSPLFEYSDGNEPYDYVVEKLAIRKVPLTLFATAEDLEGQSVTSATTQPGISKRTEKRVPTTGPLAASKSSVTFSSYYKMVPAVDADHISRSTLTRPETLFATISGGPEEELACISGKRHQKGPTILSDDDESLLVSHILNKHSSLYTLDSKEQIPKDPDHFSKHKTVVPESVKHVISRQQPSHKNKIQVEVHKSSTSKVSPSSKKTSMPPDIQQTINALGFAQKHHIPGIPPKNQKSLPPQSPITDDSAEKELRNVLVVTDNIQESPLYATSAHMLETNNRMFEGKKGYLSNKQRSEHDELLSAVTFDSRFVKNAAAQQNAKSVLVATNKPYDELPFVRNSAGPLYCSDYMDKCTMATSVKSTNEVQLSPGDEMVNTLNNSDHCTEISQLKGQNLKWKIIIKHHSDKNKQEGQNTPTTTDSDSESEDETYTHDRSSSR